MDSKIDKAELPGMSTSLWSDLYHYFLQKPENETLITFESASERVDFSHRILQRLGIGVDQYDVLNIHKIGIDVPGRYIFEELLGWDGDSVYWPNRLATVKRRDGVLDHIEIFLFGRDRVLSFGRLQIDGLKLPPLFVMDKLRFSTSPSTSDMDNARSLLYECSGGYPIGIFAMYVRSSIAEQNEREVSQLFFTVAFDFFGKQNWFNSHLLNNIWENIHNRATTNILNRIKNICEYKFGNIQNSRNS